jgi:hypothetical protein
MKRHKAYHRPEVFFRQGLSRKQKERIKESNRRLMEGE